MNFKINGFSILNFCGSGIKGESTIASMFYLPGGFICWAMLIYASVSFIITLINIIYKCVSGNEKNLIPYSTVCNAIILLILTLAYFLLGIGCKNIYQSLINDIVSSGNIDYEINTMSYIPFIVEAIIFLMDFIFLMIKFAINKKETNKEHNLEQINEKKIKALRDYKNLLEEKVITKEEFDELKNKILQN